MIPKEKAQELFNKYFAVAESIEWSSEETALKAEKLNDELGDDVLIYWNELAKQSALIAVDEMLSKDEKIIVSHKLSSYKTANDFNENFKHIQNELDSYVLFRYSYWQEVKHEITQL
jgi:hypothetical protein